MALRVCPSAKGDTWQTSRQPDTDLPLGAPLFWNQLSVSWMGYQLLVECSLYTAIIHISREQIGSCLFQGHQCKVNTVFDQHSKLFADSVFCTSQHHTIHTHFRFLYQSPSSCSTSPRQFSFLCHTHSTIQFSVSVTIMLFCTSPFLRRYKIKVKILQQLNI